MSCVPHSEKLAISTQVTNAGGAVVAPSPFDVWGMFSGIIGTLIVEDVDADGSDELVVELVSRLNSAADWFPIMTFVTVLGNTTDPDILQQTLAVNKDSVFGWGNQVALRATPGSGGTEDFTFTFIVEAN